MGSVRAGAHTLGVLRKGMKEGWGRTKRREESGLRMLGVGSENVEGKSDKMAVDYGVDSVETASMRWNVAKMRLATRFRLGIVR